MVVKSELKLIKNLQQKKYRTGLQRFVAEGVKTVQELLDAGYTPHILYCTDDSLLRDQGDLVRYIKLSEMERLSGLKSPNKMLAVFDIPQNREVSTAGWILALDGLQDPGNLGTIIRLCDWYGISDLICSENTVDCYNSKVVQASMGSIARVAVHYLDLAEWLKSYPHKIFGAVLDGINMYTMELPEIGVLVMGGEAHGISKEVMSLVHYKLTLPQFGRPSAESLNVAMASAICLSEIRRMDLLTQK